MRRLALNAFVALGAAVGYGGCAVIGTLLSVPPSGFAIIWPATAFLIAMLLMVPTGRWWLCAAGAVPAHFMLAAAIQPAAPFIVAATQIAGNLLLAAMTVLALRRTIPGRIRFDTFGSLLKFVLVAGIAVPAVVNLLILAVHLATGWTDDLALAWRQWMLAGIFPTVTIPPLLVLSFEGGLTGKPIASRRTRLELAALAPLLFALSFLSFGGNVDGAHWPAIYLTPFPILLWAAVRLGVGGTAFSLLAFATAIMAQALRHNGPFAAPSPIEDVISLQAFLITISIPLILLAALIDERRRTADLLRHSEARLQVAASSTDTGLWQWDERAQQLWLTQNCRSMFGLTAAATPTPYAFLDAVHPEDRTRVAALLEIALTSGTPRSPEEFRLRSANRTRWFVMHSHTEMSPSGKPIRVSGVFRDVTDRAEAQIEAERLRQRILSLRDDERRRIAEDLHESTAQHLVAANLNLFNLKTRVSQDMHGLVDDILQSVREASNEIRTFAYLLHPPRPDDKGLSKVLRQFVPGFERRTGVGTSLRVTRHADRLPPDQQQAILRIVQEGLGNVHRHARATKVAISVRCISGNVHLVVRDDGEGIGFEAARQLSERLRLGLDIAAMTVRVRQLGPGAAGTGSTGTMIHVAIPLRSDAGAGARKTPDGVRRSRPRQAVG